MDSRHGRMSSWPPIIEIRSSVRAVASRALRDSHIMHGKIRFGVRCVLRFIQTRSTKAPSRYLINDRNNHNRKAPFVSTAAEYKTHSWVKRLRRCIRPRKNTLRDYFRRKIQASFTSAYTYSHIAEKKKKE